nr:MAG TPA: hypothetical protein [Caudoviricetes sp.]
MRSLIFFCPLSTDTSYDVSLIEEILNWDGIPVLYFI